MDIQDTFNKKAVYRDKIEPIINQLKSVCNVENLPMFVTVAIANDENGTTYKNEIIYASTDTRLADHKIGKLLLLLNEFQTQPPLHIQACARDLQEYLDKLRISSADTVPVGLKDDKIREMSGIINGDDRVGLPNNKTAQLLSEDLYEDL